MYDLEILVPAESQLVQRFVDFKRWGIRNVGNYKVKLVLAASFDNDVSVFEGGWPDGVDVEIAVTPYKHVAQRIYHYYDAIAKPNTAKWYYRVDEDSINDIGGLMNNLETHFDHEREYHITGELNWDVQPVERYVLEKLGYNHWYRHSDDTPPHEYEMSVTSNAAMSLILNDTNAQKYFKLRKELPEGYGDHGLCFCARMVKVHPTTVKFLTIRPEICKFSEFQGQFNHIHWVGRDKNPCVMDWLDSMAPEKESSYAKLSFIWWDENDHKKWIFLNPNNVIEEVFMHSNHKNRIGLWSATNEGKLTFYLDGNMAQNYPLVVFEATSGSNDVITYACRNHRIKTGTLSALIGL
jgi:hypothetical protein